MTMTMTCRPIWAVKLSVCLCKPIPHTQDSHGRPVLTTDTKQDRRKINNAGEDL